MRTAPFRHATAPLDLRDRTSRHCLSRQAKDYTLKSGMVPSVGRVEIAGNAAETQNHASTHLRNLALTQSCTERECITCTVL